MAYVRKRGNQIAIVQGEREKGSRNVRQRILFTLYSKPEAMEAIGLGAGGGAGQFRNMMEFQYPGISWNWKRIARDVRKLLYVLPDEYPYRETRLLSGFRRDLRAFVHQLVRVDPQELFDSSELICEHEHELRFLKEMLEWRVQDRKQQKDAWNVSDCFYWRFELLGHHVPPEVEELAEAYFDSGDLAMAKAAFRLLIECFDDYAEGHNYLGLIALHEDDLEEAEDRFRRTVEVGRRLFPARISKRTYGSDHKTRPYIRGLRNLALTLNRRGKYEEALDLCRRLEEECGDRDAADAHRGTIYLNLGRWQEAAAAALRLHGLFPSESFVAAFALSELGRSPEAIAEFLRAAIHFPRAARMILGLRPRGKEPASTSESVDPNVGGELLRDLQPYLSRAPRTKRFFRKMLRLERVDAILDEADNVARRWRHQRRKGCREAFDRMREIESVEFARERAKEIAPILLPDAGRRRKRGAS